MINIVDLKNQFFYYSYKLFERGQFYNTKMYHNFLIEKYPGTLVSLYAPKMLSNLYFSYQSGFIVDDGGRHKRRQKILSSYKENRYADLVGKYGKASFPTSFEYLKYNENMMLKKSQILKESDVKYLIAICIRDNLSILRDFLVRYEFYIRSKNEADDLIGYIALKKASEGFKVNIVSTDKDFYQLWDFENVKQNILINNLSIDDVKIPRHGFLLTKALLGDRSDSIPKALFKGKGEIFLESASIEEVNKYVDKKMLENNIKLITIGEEYLSKEEIELVDKINFETTWNFYDKSGEDELSTIFQSFIS